jgi:3,4-dihydroxy 2-butanone 4-phosphate synthase/GTP cyclohydrolase II
LSQSRHQKLSGFASPETKAEPGLMKNAVKESAILRSVRATLARLLEENKAIPRPAVTLAFAQSLDGCITACKGSSTAISGDQSFFMTHQLRAMHDAILVGINTVLVDDPQLTVRYADGENPIPVVLDSRLRTPPTAKFLHQDKRQAIIVTLQNASKQRESKLVEAGARVIRMPEAPAGGIRLTDLFRWLREQYVNTLMIEGGSKVICSVLADRLVDQLVLTIAPRFFGRSGVSAVETLNCAQSLCNPSLTNVEVEQLGDDLVVHGSLVCDDTDPVDQ